MKNKKTEQNNTELEKLKEDFVALENQLKRAVADYQNLEKRVAEGRSELMTWASGNLILQILPSLDHLEKALEGANESEKASGWFKGVEMSVKQLQEILKNEGLEQIKADGQFDPILHEAVDTRDPSDAEAMGGKGEGSILEIVRKGYNLNGKVLRPAQVVVGRKGDK